MREKERKSTASPAWSFPSDRLPGGLVVEAVPGETPSEVGTLPGRGCYDTIRILGHNVSLSPTRRRVQRERTPYPNGIIGLLLFTSVVGYYNRTEITSKLGLRPEPMISLTEAHKGTEKIGAEPTRLRASGRNYLGISNFD